MVLFFIAATVFGSCTSLAYKAFLSKEAEEKILVNLDNNQIVVFLPMMHIGYDTFYKEVSKKVDSLSTLGYHFILESPETNSIDSIKGDEVLRKLRKLIGAQPGPALVNRVDTVRRLIVGEIPYPKDLNLVEQPSYE